MSPAYIVGIIADDGQRNRFVAQLLVSSKTATIQQTIHRIGLLKCGIPSRPSAGSSVANGMAERRAEAAGLLLAPRQEP
jgi:hypothetical protein